MKKEIEKQRNALRKLIGLKEDILEAEIMRVRSKENQIGAKAAFQTQTLRDWEESGQFTLAEAALQSRRSANEQLKTLNALKTDLQREKLKLNLAKKNLFRDS